MTVSAEGRRDGRLRIALTHPYCWPEVRRGGERYLHELARSLAARGHTVTVFAGASSSGVTEEHGARFVRVARALGEDATLRAERSFGRRVLLPLVRGRFDVVHSFMPSDALSSLRARRIHPGRRTVFTCLGSPIRAFWDHRPDARAHDRVVAAIGVYGCMSRFALDRLMQDYGRPGALTPGGVRLDEFRPVTERAPAPTLLYSGTLDAPRKGVATLLEAVAILARTRPGVRLLLSGDGRLAEALLSAAPEAARIRTEVLGWTTQRMPERYSSAWVTVLPSVDEAFGFAVIESLACGTPVVVADHAALPELVRPGIGYIAPPKDPSSLAAACDEALDLAVTGDARDRCREAARRFDWDTAVVPHIESLYAGGGGSSFGG